MPEITLQDRKRRVTRDHIESTALKLFAERGYDATTIEDIAQAAGMSARTFFRYFATKEDVVFADHVDELERFTSALNQEPLDAPLPTRVRRALAASRLVEPTPELEVRQHLTATVPAIRDRVHRLQLDYQATVTDYLCQLDPAVPRTHAMMIAGAIFGAFITVPDILAADFSSGPADELLAGACELLENGIG
jgi:AcrR family transcriptional regulator